MTCSRILFHTLRAHLKMVAKQWIRLVSFFLYIFKNVVLSNFISISVRISFRYLATLIQVGKFVSMRILTNFFFVFLKKNLRSRKKKIYSERRSVVSIQGDTRIICAGSINIGIVKNIFTTVEENTDDEQRKAIHIYQSRAGVK